MLLNPWGKRRQPKTAPGLMYNTLATQDIYALGLYNTDNGRQRYNQGYLSPAKCLYLLA